MSSNVTLRSNIYVNKTASSDDKLFLQHITDYRILKKYSGYSTYKTDVVWMTDVQKQILRQGQPDCSYEKGTKSWGVPVGGVNMQCRCEQYDCHLFPECSKYWNFSPVIRECVELPLQQGKEKVDPLHLYEEPAKHTSEVEVSASIEPITVEPTYGTEQIEGAGQPTDELMVEESDPIIEEIEELGKVNEERQTVDQDTIIYADIHDRIWVNAGPGTGKTYTVIQRLKMLLDAEVDGTILVLCFSRNAVQVIRDRLAEAIGSVATALIDDGSLVIRTFDSFASYILDDELNTAWDYNQRIEAFIRTISKNTGSLNDMLSYLIVDEIQDTVGVRARMLLALLDELTCGVLLLGDSCQSIFDWTIRDAGDMSFADLSIALEKRKFKRYELEGNRRQSKELAAMGLQLREKLLHSSENEQEVAVNDYKQWVREKWRTYTVKALPQFLSGNTDLILCKTNGEAAHVSQQLYESNAPVEHMMKQSSSHRSLASWIAKCLFGNDGNYMTREAFIKNATDYEIDDVEEKWDVLKSLDGHEHAPVLHIKEVLAALSNHDGLPEICLNQFQESVVISTVHRAKGSEAEHVYWLDSPLVYDNQQDQEGALIDSIKAAYVAATRAKKDIHLLDPDKHFYMRSLEDGRWIQIGISKAKKQYCQGIALLPDDVDVASFVPIEQADNVQAILACLQPGVPVDLYPNEEMRRFDIFFDGQLIGYTSSEFTAALFAGFDATNHNRNWPAKIPDVYIAAITTEIAPDRTDTDSKYRTTGCWLGIELGGFPKLEWY